MNILNGKSTGHRPVTGVGNMSLRNNGGLYAYSARTAHPFQRNGAPFRFKLSKTQQVD